MSLHNGGGVGWGEVINGGSMDAIRREMERTPGLQVTMPNLVDDALLED